MIDTFMTMIIYYRIERSTCWGPLVWAYLRIIYYRIESGSEFLTIFLSKLGE